MKFQERGTTPEGKKKPEPKAGLSFLRGKRRRIRGDA